MSFFRKTHSSHRIMLECILDMREAGLIRDMMGGHEEGDGWASRVESLTVGDLLIQQKESPPRPLLLIERKTVTDLRQSLLDGRYHDQRKRWKQMMVDHPSCRVAVWIEGDLLSLEPTMTSTLLNALLRLQSIHRILVYQVRDRNGFVRSLRMVLEKLVKTPLHLVEEEATTTATSLDMGKYKKTRDVDAHCLWSHILASIPGLSRDTAPAIMRVFPTLCDLIQRAIEDPDAVEKQLAEIRPSDKRRLGSVLARRIVGLLLTDCRQEKKEEKKKEE